MKALIFARVSTKEQKNSLETQVLACKEYCERKGYEVVQVLSFVKSIGNSKYLKNVKKIKHFSQVSTEYKKLYKLLQSNSFDVLVTYSLDRLNRDPYSGISLLGELDKRHVKLEFVFSPDKEFISSLYAIQWLSFYYAAKENGLCEGCLDLIKINYLGHATQCGLPIPFLP